MYHDQVARLFKKALEGGARRLSVSAVEWDVSGSCQQPVVTEFFGRPSAHPVRDMVRWRPRAYNAAMTEWRKPTQRAIPRTITSRQMEGVSLTVILWAKCRRCAACLKDRAAHWRLRALSETAMASRTWFGTLTLSPAEQYRAVSGARSRASKQGDDFDVLPERDRFAILVREIGAEITKFLKRLREASGSRFRYLIVAERHASGNPHFHVLLHEWGVPVRERQLSGQWRLGFCSWRLIPPDNPKAAAYVCKYLSKSAEARVRASGGYGRGHEAKISPSRGSEVGVPKREAQPLSPPR